MTIKENQKKEYVVLIKVVNISIRRSQLELGQAGSVKMTQSSKQSERKNIKNIMKNFIDRESIFEGRIYKYVKEMENKHPIVTKVLRGIISLIVSTWMSELFCV